MRWHSCEVATRAVRSDVPFVELRPFQTRSGARFPTSVPHPSPERKRKAPRMTFHAPGWMGGRRRQIECWSFPEGYRLQVEGTETFFVSRDGGEIRRTSTGSRGHAGLVADTVLGPGLILSLALQGIFCLHASGVMLGGRAVLFIGGMGAGKSTLAAFLGARQGSRWRRIVDDIAPVTLGRVRPSVLPHFPQLKLGGGQQGARVVTGRVPLRRIYRIESRAGEPEGGEPFSIRRLEPAEAVVAAVRHTVAVHLFDPDLLERLMRFAAVLESQVQVRALAYRRGHDLLAPLAEAIRADFETPAPSG